jgi:DNA polymerase I-like protein with 3'-5' exonuclease and polymerase domains/uracil-DNA glycosylase
MSFFYAEKAKPASKTGLAPRGSIPIETLARLGCKACPRDAPAWLKGLAHPKMQPVGALTAAVYLLGAEPSENEDLTGVHWRHDPGAALLDKLPRRLLAKDLRSGHVVQCGEVEIDALTKRGGKLDEHAMACCRGRVVADIEATRPVVVVGVGDGALKWATGLGGGAMTWRGRFMAARFGAHECWFYCLAWPNFAASKRKHKSEHEMALEHDVARLLDALEDGRLDEAPPIARDGYDRGIEIITGKEPGDIERLARAFDRVAKAPQSGIDIETPSLRPYGGTMGILTAAVGTFEDSVAFPLALPGSWRSEQDRREAQGLFGMYLLASGRKVAHNLGFELEWLGHEYGWDVLRRAEWGDSLAMAHTLDERPGTKSLEAQTTVEYGFNLKDQSEVNVKRPKWWELHTVAQVLRYNGMDAKWCDRLARDLEPRLRAEPTQWEQYERKVRAAPTLVLTQMMGMHADQERARNLEHQYGKQSAALVKRIMSTPEAVEFARAKRRQYQPGNDHDVLELMKMLKRPEIEREQRDGSVKLTTDEEALAAMPADEVPSAALTLELRSIDKLRGTYLKPVIEGKIILPDGLVHTSYSQFTAVSSRLSAEDPAVQNWPKRKHRQIRGVIRTPYGWVFVSCDLGQIEFRVIGMCSEDDNLVKACWTDYDVHGHWAERMVRLYPKIKDWIVAEFGVDWDEKGLKTLRQESKNGWVFPQFFGASLNSIAPRMRLPDDVAQKLDREFWGTFPGVKRWQGQLLKRYERDGYVETLDGHRRRGPMSKNEIINHPIQGTAARINIDAMNALSERAQLTDDWELHPVLNVHDDLTERMLMGSVGSKVPIIVEEMCKHRHPWINVPLLVEVSVGERWDELKEVSKHRSDVLFGIPNPYAKEKRHG